MPRRRPGIPATSSTSRATNPAGPRYRPERCYRHRPGGTCRPMTIRTPPTRPRPAVEPYRSAPEPLVIRDAEIAAGRAWGSPLRREGPAKLTGEAKYADDLVFPGA